MNYVSFFPVIENRREEKTVIMSHQLKLNCPICKYPRLTYLSHHLTTVCGIVWYYNPGVASLSLTIGILTVNFSTGTRSSCVQ